MSNVRYGKQYSQLIFCKKHEEFYPGNERCRWCDPEDTATYEGPRALEDWTWADWWTDKPLPYQR